LRDLGIIEIDEPFNNLFSQGMINFEGSKMSKSKGNIVDPEAYFKSHGADALRLYILFMAPPSDGVDWNDGGIEGTKRFLNKLWENLDQIIDMKVDESNNNEFGNEIERKLNQTIESVTNHLEKFEFNTVVSDLMILNNDLSSYLNIPAFYLISLALILVSLGTASFLPTSTDVVFRIAPSNKKGFALALLSQCFAMGYFFGPFISGRILDLFGYASIIWLSISCCCFIVFTILFKRLF